MTAKEILERAQAILADVGNRPIASPDPANIDAFMRQLERGGAKNVRIDPEDPTRILYEVTPEPYFTITLDV